MQTAYDIGLSAAREAVPEWSTEDQRAIAASFAEMLGLSSVGLSRDALSVVTGWVRERHPELTVGEARAKACVALWG